MPSDPTTEQSELRRKGRQRLIGAVALALLAVVFVPMVLDPEPRRERAEPLLAIPSKDGAAPLAPVAATPEPATPPPGATETVSAPTAEARKIVEPRATEFKSAAPRVGSAAVQTKAPVPEAKPAIQDPKLEGYAVQVGAFKDEARLVQAREKLTAAGISHFIERQPDFTRLRVGPFPTREAAEKAIAGVKRAGLDGRVVPLP